MKFVFLAHDPGGYDVIFPVYNSLSCDKNIETELLLAGPARDKSSIYAIEDYSVINNLQSKIEKHANFMLITGTSWNSTLETDAIRLCKSKCITTVSILDYWSNYKNRFRNGNTYIFPDNFLVMDDLAKKESVIDGVDEKIIHIIGHPGLDYYIGKKIKNKRNKKILFLSQPLSTLYGETYGYTEFSAFEELLDAGKTLGYAINIKFHPKEAVEMINKFRNISVSGKLEELAKEYELVVGMTTIGLLQLALMKIPVISYQPNLKLPDSCITNKLQITKGIYSYESLIANIKQVRFQKEIKYPFWCDGKSTERCCNFIRSLALK